MKKEGKKSISKVKENIEKRIFLIEEELRKLKLDLAELSDKEEYSSDEDSVKEGDLVQSKQAPYYQGEVIGFSINRYWTYIRDKNGVRRKKATHNIYKVNKLK